METIYDVIIIGGGGAGLTAALYTSRGHLKTVLFEKNISGGQIAITDLVENYPGFPEGIMGSEISAKMEEQAKKYGTTIEYQNVQKISKKDETFCVKTDEGVWHSRAVIVATGARFRMLKVPGEREYIGKGVSYCATCDAPFFNNKTVAVIGGGDAALQEGLFLTKFVRQLHIVHRRDQLRAGRLLQKRARANEKVSFELNSVVTEIKGTHTVERVILKDVKTNQTRELAVGGVFIFIGHDPVSAFVDGFIERDTEGYIKTDHKLQSSVPGIFVCGEVRHGAVWQLVAACGEGCEAALSVQHYLEKLDGGVS
ncbi:MAG: thioredoxin-disulfide reductase [Candidatus Omnitrophica bacterium]|nr:thioredoxin-disulfide reductase [Candidatus Omnitrophota bacterium]